MQDRAADGRAAGARVHVRRVTQRGSGLGAVFRAEAKAELLGGRADTVPELVSAVAPAVPERAAGDGRRGTDRGRGEDGEAIAGAGEGAARAVLRRVVGADRVHEGGGGVRRSGDRARVARRGFNVIITIGTIARREAYDPIGNRCRGPGPTPRPPRLSSDARLVFYVVFVPRTRRPGEQRIPVGIFVQDVPGPAWFEGGVPLRTVGRHVHGVSRAQVVPLTLALTEPVDALPL